MVTFDLNYDECERISSVNIYDTGYETVVEWGEVTDTDDYGCLVESNLILKYFNFLPPSQLSC